MTTRCRSSHEPLLRRHVCFDHCRRRRRCAALLLNDPRDCVTIDVSNIAGSARSIEGRRIDQSAIPTGQRIMLERLDAIDIVLFENLHTASPRLESGNRQAEAQRRISLPDFRVFVD